MNAGNRCSPQREVGWRFLYLSEDTHSASLSFTFVPKNLNIHRGIP